MHLYVLRNMFESAIGLNGQLMGNSLSLPDHVSEHRAPARSPAERARAQETRGHVACAEQGLLVVQVREEWGQDGQGPGAGLLRKVGGYV